MPSRPANKSIQQKINCKAFAFGLNMRRNYGNKQVLNGKKIISLVSRGKKKEIYISSINIYIYHQ